MNLQLQAGYFSIKSPLQIIDRWLNPYRYKDSIDIRGKKMAIVYPKRAKIALEQRNSSLIAELQLYFTCVVQKHVAFHKHSNLDTITAKNNLEIAHHTVESNACDPNELYWQLKKARNSMITFLEREPNAGNDEIMQHLNQISAEIDNVL